MYQLKPIPVILFAALALQTCVYDATTTTGSAESGFRSGQANVDCSDVIAYNETNYTV